MRPTLIFMEPSKVGHQHITLIDGYLRALRGSTVSTDYDLTLHAAPSTHAALTPAARDGLAYRELSVIDGNTRRLAAKTLLEFWVVARRIVAMRRDDVLFISCILPPALYLLELLSRVLPRRHVFVVLHGEIEGVFDPTRQRPTSYGFWMIRWLRLRHEKSWLRLVVIDTFIRDRMLVVFRTLTAPLLHVVEHPIVAHPLAPDTADDEPSASFIGYRTSAKGYDRFAALAERHRDVVFDAIGGGVVEHLADGQIEPLVGDDYFRRIAESSVALFPYTTGYTMSLSAAVLDSLATGTHVIASDLPCFRALRDAFGEDFVTICDDDATFDARLAANAWLRGQRSQRSGRQARLATSSYSLDAVGRAFERLVAAVAPVGMTA